MGISSRKDPRFAPQSSLANCHASRQATHRLQGLVVLVGLLTSKLIWPSLLAARFTSQRQWQEETGRSLLLGYSGGAVAEFHRIPCLSTEKLFRPTTNTQQRAM
jgi:hypothetical protein